MENYSFEKNKNLFLRQAYLDSWEDYHKSVNKSAFIGWDYVILTASNESQAESYRYQIEKRVKQGLLPRKTVFAVLSDPDGKRVGSGGATFNVLKYINSCCGRTMFENKRVLVIHSGGDSKRIPQYSSIGKLFSPVPRELLNGRPSTLFDEIIIGMSGVPYRFKEGMLVLSGDIQILFNPLQIDTQFCGAAALSVKESAAVGKNHGVFLSDADGNVRKFLHKLSEDQLKDNGAVDDFGRLDLDTGAVLFDKNLLDSLFELISTDGITDEDKFNEFVNERARISFYGDFLYPLSSDASLEEYLDEKAEGERTSELLSCRKKIWEAISSFSLKAIRLSPAKFIHYGTTRELLSLFTDKNGVFSLIDKKMKTKSFVDKVCDCALYCSLIESDTTVGNGSYIENSHLINCKVGENSIVSDLFLDGVTVPDNTVLHGIKLKNGKFVVRIYGTDDNPKNSISDTSLCSVCESIGINTDLDLFSAEIYPVCDTMEQALTASLRFFCGEMSMAEFLSATKVSLCSGFNNADVSYSISWHESLQTKIICKDFIASLMSGKRADDALGLLNGIFDKEAVTDMLMSYAENSDFSVKVRIYNALSRLLKSDKTGYNNLSYDEAEEKCFSAVRDMVIAHTLDNISDLSEKKIAEDSTEVFLPLRVTWGGCWSDTPPYCYENGGAVFNAAIKVGGKFPVHICVKRLNELHIEFESQDTAVHGIVTDSDEIRDCKNPFDPFTLHKAALIACGIVAGNDNGESLQDILRRIGGGIYLSTEVIGIPKGSGLGTSSILCAACVKGLYRFFGAEISDDGIYSIVLAMEQLMSTGGGWQDQVGGLNSGFKMVSSEAGFPQKIIAERIELPPETLNELTERFALVYTGQRRLARNLLRDVVLRYLSGIDDVIFSLKEIQNVTRNMASELKCGNFDAFCDLMNTHWTLSKLITPNTTNECIESILSACEDLTEARFITGAGGGGFLIIILKKGVSKEALRERLKTEFKDTNVDVWETEFV